VEGLGNITNVGLWNEAKFPSEAAEAVFVAASVGRSARTRLLGVLVLR
jgi:hypothetical protein